MKKSFSILFATVGLMSSIALADPYSNQTNEVFHELGWFRQKPNEQIVSQKDKPDFNFYDATGFRIFMSESSASVYDFISCKTPSGDFVEIFLDQITQTRSNKSELSFTYVDSNYMELTQVSGHQTLLAQTEAVLKSIKGATYKKRVSSLLGGSLVADSGKSFKDQAYLLEVLGKFCKSGLQQVK